MDSRQPKFAEEFAPMVERFIARHIPVQVIFVEADDATLLRRYSETRRPHHLSQDSPEEGIQLERDLLAPIRALATGVLDTSNLNLSDMRLLVGAMLPQLPTRRTAIRLLSFGFKKGLPVDADVILDARFLPNPYYVEDLKKLTGKIGRAHV